MLPRVLVILLLAVCGCHASHEWRQSDNPKPSLAGGVYVAVPENGSFETSVYPDSGRQTAAAVAEALRSASVRVEQGQAVEDVAAALATARTRSCAFMLRPVILHWEDRATQWSGRRDSIEVRLDLFDARTGLVVDSSTLSCRSRLMSFGGDHPQKLLAGPLREYAAGFH